MASGRSAGDSAGDSKRGSTRGGARLGLALALAVLFAGGILLGLAKQRPDRLGDLWRTWTLSGVQRPTSAPPLGERELAPGWVRVRIGGPAARPADADAPTTEIVHQDPGDFLLEVRPGATLRNIAAEHYGVEDLDLVRALRDYNGLDGSQLRSGQVLRLPEIERLQANSDE